MPEIRNTYSGAKIHKRFMEYIRDIYKRCQCVSLDTEIPDSRKLFDSRKKLGFEVVTIKMVHRGTAEEFMEKRPGYWGGNKNE